MTSPSPIPPDTASIRSESVTSTRDSASLLAEFASQAIVLLQKADPHTVVTGLLKEKAYLHTQNGQLWRLVDKQRAALLDLQKDYQKVVAEKNKYQARLKTVKQDNQRPSDLHSISTESSSLAAQDGDLDGRQLPSRHSSARSARPPPSPRSPETHAQLDALQASLEEEIGKSSDDPDSATSLPDTSERKKPVVAPPALTFNESSGEEATTASIRPKRVPTPLRLTPERVRLVSAAPQSAFLVPRSDSFDRQNGSTSLRDPPPSAPPYQTSMQTPLSPPAERDGPQMLLFSPGLPSSPRPVSFQPTVPRSTRASFHDTSSARAQGHRSPSTSKDTTTDHDSDDSSDSSSSPHTPAPISPKPVYVETVRMSMSPIAPRRARIPSHRANNSVGSSISTINEVASPPSPVDRRRASRSMSVDMKPMVGLLAPPDEMLERRKSRSFEDLHIMSNEFDAMKAAEEAKTMAEPAEVMPRTESLTASLEETIQDLQKANEAASVHSMRETPPDETEPEPPSRPAPPPPTKPSPPPSLHIPQPASGRSRAPSNAKPPVTLLISPDEIYSIALSVLSVRSKQVATPDGFVEESLFTIRCRTKSPDKGPDKEVLRVEKSVPQLKELSGVLSTIVSMSSFTNTFFADFPPEKAGQRKAVDYFLQVILGSQLDDGAIRFIAEFLSTDVVKKHDELDRVNSQSTIASTRSPTKESPTPRDQPPPRKEGYLSKKGKNFGGMQTRYFVLDSPQLRYFDAPNGVHLGSIKLPQAQIGRQTAQAQSNHEENGDEQMKYAFLILEPKRNDASKMVRHVLSSQSEEERDEWINAILYYVSLDSDSPQAAEKVRGKRLQRRTSDTSKLGEIQRVVSPEVGSDHEIIGIRYDQMAAGKRPATAVAEPRVVEPRVVEPQRQSTWPPPAPQEDASRGIDRRMARSPQPLPVVPQRSPYRQPISGPMNGAPITDDSAWSSAQREEERRREEKRVKKRSVWGFLSKDRAGRTTPDIIQATAPPPPALLQHGLFGITLQDAVDITREMGMGINIPSVVYRCIEYLEHMDAAKEEGIYRLSGSNSAIRMLKDKFNAEGDVDLVNSKDYHDVHAVAGLLKLYLRELPSTVLTRERHAEFLHIVDIEDKAARIRRLSELVRALPKVNYELLRIISRHLKRIVARAQENKMTIRNVGIVFSPTLNIPAPVFALFITEYEFVYDEPDDTPMAPSPTATPPVDSFPNNSHTSHNEHPDHPHQNHPNHHLSVHEHPSHRRYHSAEPPARRGTPPSSFPMHPHQGYPDSASRHQVHAQSQQSQYPQQQSYQQSFQQQAYRQYLAPQPSYAQAKWGSGRDDADLFGS